MTSATTPTGHERPEAPQSAPADQGAGVRRVCFQLQVRPELLDEYVARHTPVWPEMLAEIAASGRRNYSLFLGEGGRLIGYYETDDDDAAQAYLANSEVAARWEAEMGRFFVGLDGRPDQAATPLTEIFHLDDQLAAASAAASDERKRPHRDDALPRHPVHPRRPGHRAALVGVRQLRHPLPRVHDAGTPRDPYEKIADAAQVNAYTGLAPSVALHIPWDKVDDYADLRRHAEDLGVRARHDQLEHLPGRGLQVRRAHARRRPHPPQGDRPPPRVHRHHGRHRLARPEDLARRGLELPGPGRHPRPPGPPAGLAAADLRPPVGRAAARARVQVLRAVVLPHRRSGLGHVLRAGARRSATGRWSASTPATTRRARTSSSSSCSCCASESSARSTSTRASTPTTTSSSAPPTRSSCSASSSRSSAAAASTTPTSAFMLDQCHNVEDKIPGQIRSVLNVQEMTARALLVDRDALAAAQQANDVLAANAVFMDAFYTDVRPALAEWRESRGLAGRPDGRVRGIRLPAEDRRRPRRRRAGRLGSLTS